VNVVHNMRVVFLSVSDQLGGSEIALVDMMAGLRRVRPGWTVGLVLPGRGPLLARAEAAGVDCTILALPRAIARVGEFAGILEQPGIMRRAMLATRMLRAAAATPTYLRKLRKVLRAYQPAIVHTNGFKAHVFGARAVGSARLGARAVDNARSGARALGTGSRGGSSAGSAKVVWHMHEYVGDRGVSRKLLAAHVSSVSAILANSASVAADVGRALPSAVSPTVIYNAVDLASFVPVGPTEDLDARAGFPPASGSPLRVGLIATFARWKGHDVFLRAIAALPLSINIRAYVIGEPIYATEGSQHTLEDLKRLAASLGIAERVGFTGYLRSAPAMRALDIVVHASTRPEPFGLVIAEAMACGRATIVSAAGGATELIEPEINALTHAPGDAAELARQIARLAADRSLRESLGARAHATARRRFDPDRLAGELAQVYERLS
jgi:glycosyltransferase involved in cell wall biosynthesis